MLPKIKQKKYQAVPYNQWIPFNLEKAIFWVAWHELVPVLSTRFLLTGENNIPILAAAIKFKEKFDNFLAKMGFKRKADVVMNLNHMQLPNITKFTNCDIGFIDQYKSLQTEDISCSDLMFLWKMPDQHYAYKLVGRNFTAQLRTVC
ncbi:MAG: hypothetical protein ACHP9Y_05045 [Gammaproteobacteria bacterium]